MVQHEQANRKMAVIVIVAAIVIALLAIGLFSDWFGLFGTEMAPGTTTPPNNPS